MSATVDASHRTAVVRAGSTARRVARVRRWILVSMASLLAFVQLFPILWMVLGAFKPKGEANGARLLPEHPTFDNLTTVFTSIPFAHYLLNSLISSVAVTVLLV